MSNEKEVNGFIKKFSYLWSGYIYNNLLHKNIFQLIQNIIENSNKTISESVLILLAAIRYLMDDRNALLKLEKDESFNDFINENENKIIQIALQKNVQANIPERAFPIFEILSKYNNDTNFSIIELGASYGLIGHCLLNYNKLLLKKGKYFLNNQQYPAQTANIKNYFGIEINPPKLKWLLACIPLVEDEIHIENFISDINIDKNHQIMKASALEFTKLKEVIKFKKQSNKMIILTSFMLYQFDNESKGQLVSEINDFIKDNDALWINQTVNICHYSADNEYYIELNGKKIIELADDRCSKWEWL